MPHDLAARSATTGRSSMPSASRRSHSTWLPTASRRIWASAARTSISRSMPRSRSRCAVTGPTPHKRIDRQRLEEALDPLRRDHRQAVRLLPRGRNLREELVRRDAGRRGQAGAFLDRRLDAARRPRARASAPTRSPSRPDTPRRARAVRPAASPSGRSRTPPATRSDTSGSRAGRWTGAGRGGRRAPSASPSARRSAAPRSSPPRPRRGPPGSRPTATGLPRSDGSSRCSTDA